MKRAVVTGATGFIGSHICKALLNQEYEVYGVGRTEKKFEQFNKIPNFHPIILDFDRYNTLDEIISDKGFDLFFHTALFGVNGTNKKDYKIQFKNTIISCDVVKLAKKLMCKRFVFIGSVDEFESCFAPDSEFRLPNHARIYGLAKFAAENIGKTIAAEIGIEYVSALLSLTYGEGNNNNILPNMIIKNSLTNSPVDLISGDNYFDMIYIDDAVRGILAIAKLGRNMESYFVGHNDLKTFRNYVEDICAVLGTEMELRFGSYPDSDSVIRFENIRRTKITDDTGFVCSMSLKDGILKTKEWLMTQ